MLIDKVYDEFATTDWVYTQDNLNPVREIDYTGKFSVDDLRSRLLGNINARLDYLLDQQESNVKAQFDEDEAVSIPINMGVHKSAINLFENSALDYFPEVKSKMLRLQYYLGDDNIEPNLPNFDDQMLTNYFDIMKNFDCIDFDDAQRKQLNPDYFYSNSYNPISSSDFNDKLDEITGSGDFIGRPSGGSSGAGGPSGKNCAQRENALLKILLTILSIILAIGSAILMIQQIVTVINNIIATAVTVWMFGLSFPKIASILVNFITQFIMWILSLIIKLLYKLLDFRCFKDSMWSFLDMIDRLFAALTAIIAGLKNIAGISKSLPSSIQQAFSSLLQKIKNLQVNVNVNKQSMRDKLKEAFDFSNFSAELKEGLKNGSVQVVVESDFAKDAMELYQKSMETAHSAALAWSTLSGNDSNALTQGLSKLANKVENLKVKQIGE
jgi:hypothetical protein